MRGAHKNPRIPEVPSGIIPADAGSTRNRPGNGFKFWDHPRGCGEHGAPPYDLLHVPGSSPRMRGAQSSVDNHIDEDRIIPADAGSTRLASVSCAPSGDHPRGCGEHPNAVAVNEMQQGSSPRMRGAHIDPIKRPDIKRIIPADAGSTPNFPTIEFGIQDHPRGCGEHFQVWWWLTNEKGSSPRMRGAPVGADVHQEQGRIIPADAGSTQEMKSFALKREDHPRGCGEHRMRHTMKGKRKGSSPRMRGALKDCINGIISNRIIPADAGSTGYPLSDRTLQ